MYIVCDNVYTRRNAAYMYMYMHVCTMQPWCNSGCTCTDCLGCAVLRLVCLLASFFLPSHLSFKDMYMYMYMYNTAYAYIHVHVRCEIWAQPAVALP